MEFNATFFISVISFILFVLIMNKMFYAPITEIILKRENIMSANYDEANSMNVEAEGLLKNREDKLTSAENQAREVIADSIKSSNEDAKVDIQNASKNAKDDISAKKEILNIEMAQAKETLKEYIDNLALAIESKVMDIPESDNNLLKNISEKQS